MAGIVHPVRPIWFMHLTPVIVSLLRANCWADTDGESIRPGSPSGMLQP